MPDKTVTLTYAETGDTVEVAEAAVDAYVLAGWSPPPEDPKKSSK